MTKQSLASVATVYQNNSKKDRECLGPRSKAEGSLVFDYSTVKRQLSKHPTHWKPALPGRNCRIAGQSEGSGFNLTNVPYRN